jgi:23S rRNA (cytosine1962-C5)-methyltransferase
MDRPAAAGDRGVELLDAGEMRRLERFGSMVVDRPAPTAIEWRRNPDAWAASDLRFDAGSGWSGRAWADTGAPEPWPVEVDGLTLELRPTSSGGLGLYPEHGTNLGWLGRQIGARIDAGRAEPAVLNLFAHTGLLTLAAARAGAAVAHVDGARTTVDWARRNAELSGLADKPVRWLVDDAATFVAREARRGRRYDGIVLDPPSFGHARGRRWRLADELPDLLAGCAAILADDCFLLLTAHTAGLDGGALSDLLRSAFPSPAARITAETLDLVATSGARLDLGSRRGDREPRESPNPGRGAPARAPRA